MRIPLGPYRYLLVQVRYPDQCECCQKEMHRRKLVRMISPNGDPRWCDPNRWACRPCADKGGCGLGWTVAP